MGILAENGEAAKRWPAWLALAVLFLGLILLLVYAHHNWIENFASPVLWWRTAYGVAFAMFSAAMAFTVPTISLRLSSSSLRLLDAMQPSAYGIFLFHYMFIIWLQYVVYDPAWPAGVKAAIVFAGTLGALAAYRLAAKNSVGGADDLIHDLLPSCPALCRASTSCLDLKRKTWTAGSIPAMTTKSYGFKISFCTRQFRSSAT